MAEFQLSKSRHAYTDATKVMPGGVNSPVRAFKGVGGDPIFFSRGEGPYLYDLDGNRYIDFVQSWGPLIVGHAHPCVNSALHRVLDRGTSFGAPTVIETRMATKVRTFFPSMEVLRFVNSGTEAAMSALRLARAFTGRDKIIKFTGNYHGHVDALLVQAGSGVATLGLPDSPGVPGDVTSGTVSVPYNDLDAVREAFRTFPDNIAAIAVEPVAGNMGFVPPVEGFLPGLREIADEYGAVLLFDEVMTGFRVSRGGAQERFGVTPDLTCLGKVIGGGLPVGAYGGREDIMRMVAPDGPVYQAGTLSGNPLAMTGGLATLELIDSEETWSELRRRGARLSEGINRIKYDLGIAGQYNFLGTMSGLYFSEKPVRNYDDAKASDTERYRRFFWACAERGLYLAPSAFEAMFIGTCHTNDVIDDALNRFEDAFREVR